MPDLWDDLPEEFFGDRPPVDCLLNKQLRLFNKQIESSSETQCVEPTADHQAPFDGIETK